MLTDRAIADATRKNTEKNAGGEHHKEGMVEKMKDALGMGHHKK